MGFAGLGALATELPPEPRFDPTPTEPAPDAGAARPAEPESRRVASPTFWTGERLWAATVGIGLIGLVAVANWPKDTSFTGAASPPAANVPTQAANPAQPAYVLPDRSAESKPVGASGQILSLNEIRYCLSERVRVEAMSDYIDSTRQSHIDRYNALVGDYNARCSNYRYRQVDMDTVRASVDRSGDLLKAQAAATVRQWP
jgi:hypothetical protein